MSRSVEMFKINQWYKFELPNRFFYTGKVLKEDATNIEIHTIRDEKVILNKSKIIQSIETEWSGNNGT